MGHGKETPRQKMIGMMYLVLTALLALNVQKSVLDAFVNVDHGINKTIENFVLKNDLVYQDFGQKATVNQEKVGPFFNKAMKVKEESDKLYNMIQELKKKIIITSEGEDTPAVEGDHIELKHVGGKDNMDVPAQIMITEGNAKKLKETINSYRHLLEEFSDGDEEIKKSLEKSLDTHDHHLPDGTPEPWENANFTHLPLAGVIAIMSGMQTDIRNSESEVLNYLYQQVDAGSFKFNKLEATIIPNTNYVIKGNEYRAEIFLAASDTTQDPIVLIGSYDSTITEDGVVEYKMRPGYDSVPVKSGRGLYVQRGTGIGSKSYKGLIKLQNPDGGFTVKPFTQSYQVSESSAGVNPTKMNVFYLGVDNPVEIFVSGIPNEKVSASITNGRIRRMPDDTWIVNPKTPGNALIEILAEIDGKKQSMGWKEFRVKEVPDPVAKVAGKKGGGIQKSLLEAQAGVIADMENFDFDLDFRVTEFVVSAVVSGFTREYLSNNNRFTKQQKNLIDNLSTGARVYIQDIKAVGPDGTVRKLNTISFKII